MDVGVRRNGDVTILDLTGKVTIGLGNVALREKVFELVSQGPHQILINLAQVPYMDSSGIGELVRCHVRAKDAGSNIKLLNPKRRVYDVLQAVKLHQIFECFYDEESAVRSFEGA